jgi:hypothetical protein
MANPIAFIKRPAHIAVAFVLGLTALAPLAVATQVNAGQPVNRSITIATSAAGATDVQYDVAFTTSTDSNGLALQGIVIEFCSNSPIIGDSCTAPTGFDINEAGLVFSDTIAGGAFAINGATTDANTLVLTRTDATGIADSTALTLTLGAGGGTDGVTNPSTSNATFFARILTYTDNDDDSDGCSGVDDNATCYASTTPRVFIDAGGIALSTAAQIVVTAKVAERLTFCVYTLANCGAGGTNVSLGDTNGILDPAGPFVDKNTKFDISTNASGNAVVVLKGATLTNGTPTITAIGGTAATSNPGNEQYGICLYESAGTGLTIAAPYNNGGTPANCNTQTTQTAGTGATGGAGTALFAFDTTSTTSTTGDLIATKPAGNSSTATIPMIGNVANATEAGIYTTTLTFVATGTY